MNFSQPFFRTTAICSFAAAILLIALSLLQASITVPANPGEIAEALKNPAYLISLWLNFALVFLVLITMWGVAAKKMSSSAGLATMGFIFLSIDFISTLLYHTSRIFTFHFNWATRFAMETDEKVKSDILAKMSFYNDLMPALFFLIIFGSAIGMLLFGMATWHGKGIVKAVSVFFLLAALNNFTQGIGYFASLNKLSGLVAPISPFIITILLFVTGAWLWKTKDAGEAAVRV